MVNIPSDTKPSREDVSLFETFVQDVLNKNNTTVQVQDITYLNNDTLAIVSERLTDKYSLKLDVKDKVVLDLGANILDTALQYAYDGAKKIYAYEALPPTYEIALKNLELNKQYEDQITVYNYAISKEELLKIPYENGVSSPVASSFNTANNKKIYEIPTKTVNELIEEIPEQIQVLKMDIEGSEFEFVDDTKWDYFDEILMEYHSFLTNIPYDKITNKLESYGFKIELIPTSYYDIKDVGLIYAVKE